MSNQIIKPATSILGNINIPADKSISHRSLLISSLCKGTTIINNLLQSEDINATKNCLIKLGVNINTVNHITYLTSYNNFNQNCILNCQNSGTTMRLLLGILAGKNINTTLIGDTSLSKRPMDRVTKPLKQMGAKFSLIDNNYAPIKIRSHTKLSGIEYNLEIASAQVKSAILLASLYADKDTIITGKINSRDHTEKMLNYLGANIITNNSYLKISPCNNLIANTITIPNDPSSAAFWIVAALIIPNSEIKLTNILLNKTRIAFINVLLRMGAKISVKKTHSNFEDQGEITICYTKNLQATKILPDEIPYLIDELPLFAIIACFAEGLSVVKGAEELKVKESDRLQAIQNNLSSMGVNITIYNDGFSLIGKQKIHACTINSYHDHRIAMAFSIAALSTNSETTILNADCVNISYPNFFQTLNTFMQ